MLYGNTYHIVDFIQQKVNFLLFPLCFFLITLHNDNQCNTFFLYAV